MADPRIVAVILAAGKGTRLKSELPKVLHEVCGRPMLAYVLDACRAAEVRDCIGVVGHRKELVIDAFDDDRDVAWVEQSPQLGTGHAVMVCPAAIKDYDHVLVLCGDGPLIRSQTISTLLDRHLSDDNAVTLATAILDDPAGYGRIWRDADGKLLGIVEHVDANTEQLKIREVNPSYYCFKAPDLREALGQLSDDNAKGEYYITDTLGILMNAGRKAGAVTSVDPEDIYGINSRQDLALVNDVMRRRVLDRLMSTGVTIVDPTTTWIDTRATIGQDTIVRPFVDVSGPARIGCNCRIGPFVHLTGPAEVADNTTVAFSGGSA